MAELKICRICLRTECKVYKFDRYQLKPYYEEVMALKMNDKDGLPHYFCYECATMLHKFHRFKEKCYMGQQVLKEISWRGLITYEAVYKIDRALKNLKSPLEIITVTKRVRTYCTRDDFEATESETEYIKDETETDKNRQDIEVQFVSEDSMNDRDDHIDPETDPVDENSKFNENKVESSNDDKKIEIEIQNDNNDPISPKTVFVDVKREVITLKSEKIKERKKVTEYGIKKQNPNFAKKRTRFLDSSNWKKYNLTEEEAIKEFRSKSEDPKYSSAAYQCADCFKGFSKEEMLKRHKQLRHSESLGALECRFCHMRFKWDCHLRKHLRQHFTKYMCLRCSLVCSLEQTAMLHEDYHNGVIKTCIHCGEEFRHTSTYYSHLRTHRSEHVCALCGASFVSPLGLHQHKKVKHVTDDIESPDDDEEVNTFCDKCDIRFETRKAYLEHLFHSAMHTEGVEEELDEISIPRKVLGKKQQAQITYELKSRKASDEKAPTERKRRRKPKRIHRKPTSCHQCGKRFETQQACMKHHLSEHPRTSFFAANERHICEICGASLAPGSVAAHQNMHSRDKVHPCDACGRSFHSTVGLKRHLVTHTGEKPYGCSLCDKRFTQSNSMKLHYRTFHLKQPYPKRNRRKKKEEPPGAAQAQEKSTDSEEETDESQPESAPQAAPGTLAAEGGIEPVTGALAVPDRHVGEENMHYLTLS